MIVGVPSETCTDERRVALVPAGVASLSKIGCTVQIESGAGEKAGFPDQAFEEAGATVIQDRGLLFEEADVIVQIRGGGANPEKGAEDVARLREGQVLIGFLEPLAAFDEIKEGYGRSYLTLTSKRKTPVSDRRFCFKAFGKNQSFRSSFILSEISSRATVKRSPLFLSFISTLFSFKPLSPTIT